MYWRIIVRRDLAAEGHTCCSEQSFVCLQCFYWDSRDQSLPYLQDRVVTLLVKLLVQTIFVDIRLEQRPYNMARYSCHIFNGLFYQRR